MMTRTVKSTAQVRRELDAFVAIVGSSCMPPMTARQLVPAWGVPSSDDPQE